MKLVYNTKEETIREFFEEYTRVHTHKRCNNYYFKSAILERYEIEKNSLSLLLENTNELYFEDILKCFVLLQFKGKNYKTLKTLRTKIKKLFNEIKEELKKDYIEAYKLQHLFDSMYSGSFRGLELVEGEF